MGAFWVRNREFIIFVIAVVISLCLLGRSLKPPETIILHDCASSIPIPEGRDSATVPEIAP